MIDNLVDDIAAASHTDNDMFGFRMSNIIKDLIMPAGDCTNVVQSRLHNLRNCFVVEIASLCVLEECVTELTLLTTVWVIWMETALSISLELFPWNQLRHCFVGWHCRFA